MAISLKSPLPSAGKARFAIREILICGLLGALLIAAQVALAFLPNIELVSLLVIVYTLVLGKKVFFPIYVFALVEGLIYGFGIWWISYLYIWSILAIVVLMLRKYERPLFWVIVSGLFGLMFGALCAVPYLFTGGLGAAAAYWVSGIMFDLLHCGGNIVAAALLFKPCYGVMKKLYLREQPQQTAASLPK
jgi:energy-coupling factor transport system substrate-specific component